MKPILAVVLAALMMTACHQNANRPKPQAKAPLVTKVAGTVDLPDGDGRVYVIESPADDFGFEVNACMLHVKGNSSSMSCTPPKMKLPESPE